MPYQTDFNVLFDYYMIDRIIFRIYSKPNDSFGLYKIYFSTRSRTSVKNKYIYTVMFPPD